MFDSKYVFNQMIIYLALVTKKKNTNVFPRRSNTWTYSRSLWLCRHHPAMGDITIPCKIEYLTPICMCSECLQCIEICPFGLRRWVWPHDVKQPHDNCSNNEFCLCARLPLSLPIPDSETRRRRLRGCRAFREPIKPPVLWACWCIWHRREIIALVLSRLIVLRCKEDNFRLVRRYNRVGTPTRGRLSVWRGRW